MYTFTEPYRFIVEVALIHILDCLSFLEVLEIYVYIQPVVKITTTETQIFKNDQIILTANLSSNKTNDIIPTGYNTEGSYQYDIVTVVSHENIPDGT